MSTMFFSASQAKARAQEIENLSNEFRNQANALSEKEQQLKAMYEGEAANAFHNAFSRDRVQMDNFYNCIMRYAQVLREIANTIEQAERVNTEIATTRVY